MVKVICSVSPFVDQMQVTIFFFLAEDVLKPLAFHGSLSCVCLISCFRYEHFFGRLSSSNICVTQAMRDDLRKNWNIQ